MTPKQNGVMWVGLALMILNLVKDWGVVKATANTTSSQPSGSLPPPGALSPKWGLPPQATDPMPNRPASNHHTQVM